MLTTTPNGLPEIIQVFGDIHDPNFEAKYIAPFTLPYPIRYAGVPKTTARCHHLLADNFIAVFTDIQTAGLIDKANDYSGIFATRPIRGYSKFPSCHSWGIAIDLEATDNPLGSTGHMDPGVIAIFKKHGFFWGGDFIHRHDPMHFQFATGY
jgi:hypothetical protein